MKAEHAEELRGVTLFQLRETYAFSEEELASLLGESLNFTRAVTLYNAVLRLEEILTRRGISKWLQAPNRLLDGKTPSDAIKSDAPGKILNAAASFVESFSI